MKQTSKTRASRTPDDRARGRSESSLLPNSSGSGSSGAEAARASEESSLESAEAGRAEAELIRLAQQGQRPALNTLFGRYRPDVVNLARRRMGSRLQAKEDPEDLAQTTFREAARDFSGYEYRGDRSFFGWLSRILRNKIRDRAEFHSAARRDSSREVSFTRSASADGTEQPQFEPAASGLSGLSGLEQVELREQLELLHEHLEELSPLHREAIRLVYFEGLSLGEAGKRLGKRSEAAIRMLIRRAADRLKESLKRD